MTMERISWFLDRIEAPFAAVGDGDSDGQQPEWTVDGEGRLPSAFAVTELATASIAAAGRAAARVAGLDADRIPAVSVDRRLASAWFGWTLDPVGWTAPSAWDALAGIYRAEDGWIRLHTNAPHHRRAALEVLGLVDSTIGPTGRSVDRADVETAVAGWSADDLEQAVVDHHGCAAMLRSESEWLAHPQGSAVAGEPMVHVNRHRAEPRSPRSTPTRLTPTRSTAARSTAVNRPLRGVRVLDLTRVLAGPIATRFLAGLGADVLRLDPPDWDEPGVVHEVTLGKRCGRIDLKTGDGRQRLVDLITKADIMVHGYRGDALTRLDLGDEVRRAANPGLIDVSLNAYGWTGPWRHRRGFDSLVQMSSGIANTGGELNHAGSDDPFEPRPLPVQALDHATGYVMATAALDGWRHRLDDGSGLTAKVSLARTAKLLLDGPGNDLDAMMGPGIAALTDADYRPGTEYTSWGPGRRLVPPLTIDGIDVRWDRPATALGTEPEPAWISD